MSFDLLSPQTRSIIREKGFLQPTLAQKMSIEPILKGENVLLIAPTGIGKTEAAMLPLFDKIKAQKEESIALLYVTPLRSLNRDLLDRLVWWANKLELEIGVRHGDTPQSERKAQVEIPPHVLITTPESLQGMLVGKRMREHLKNIKHVVVDEIHELVQSKRGIQLAVALERLAEIAGGFQRIGLSATVGSPETVAEFLAPKTKIIRADAKKRYDIRVESPKPSTGDTALAEELFVQPMTAARLRRLHELIVGHTSVLAFTNTRETAEVLSSRLHSLEKELKQEVHHGSLARERRMSNEKKFKTQEIKAIIATSSLELGIDIGSCDLVVQYLSPRQVARLIQRVGRAGHKVGEVSKGVLLSGQEDAFESAVIATKAMKRELEPVRIHEMALDVLATQIVGLAMEYGEIGDERILQIIKRAYPFHSLTRESLIEILKFLESIHIIWLNPYLNEARRGALSNSYHTEAAGRMSKSYPTEASKKPDNSSHSEPAEQASYTVRKRLKAFTHYFENLSMIPDTQQYRVISIIQNEPVGALDEDFVAEHGKPGERFIVSGRAWKIIQVDSEKKKITVEPAHDIESAIPAWEGELIPVPFEIAQDIGKLRRLIASSAAGGAASEKLKELLPVDSDTVKDLVAIVEKHAKTHSVPDDRTWLIEPHEDFVIVHACNGSQVNDTIGRYLAAILSAKTGVAVNVKNDPYRIMLQTRATPEHVVAALKEADKIEDVLSLALCRSSLFRHRFMHVARRFGILRRGAQFERVSLQRVMNQYDDTPAWKETLREIMVDKMDIAKASEVLAKVKEGKIKLTIEKGLSHLGELGLVHQFAEVMKPAQPDEEIFKAFKRRLLATRIRLVCMNCGDYTIAKEVKELEDEPECPKCSSRLIGIVKRTMDIEKIVRKKLKKKPLTDEEMEAFQQAHRAADLVIVYGKTACIALAGHGVGPETAARILSKLHSNKEALFKDILEAEKLFAKTKPFWS